VTEVDIINRVLRQAHPEYLAILHGRRIRSLAELKELAFQAQELIKQRRLYEPPPTEIPIEPSLAWQPVGQHRSSLQPERSLHSVIQSNMSNPQVHFASVDPFMFHHSSSAKRVTIQEPELPRVSSPQRVVSPNPTGNNYIPRSLSSPTQNNRERRDSEGNNNSPRRCFVCQSLDHLANACPQRRSNSPNSGNGRSPSPRRQ
jgi:hypothetical protein